jgi:hypothetical protein
VFKPVRYDSELQLYRNVYECWTHNWDATDPRYYHIVSAETLLLRRWQEHDDLPHLFFYGPPHSGKGQALKIFQKLASRPLLVSGPSVSSIYQVIELLKPVLLMDEVDRLSKVKENSDYIQSMLQVLKVYERLEVTMRASRENGTVKLYDLFCPKILAGQNPLPGSLPDRCIRLDCEKNVKDVPIDIEVPDTLRGQLEYYGVRHSEYRGLSKQELKQMLGDNRIVQLFYPLFSSCPDPAGQKVLLELAHEQLVERDQEERDSELCQVVEQICKEIEAMAGATIATVLTDVERTEPYYVNEDDLARDCGDIVPNGLDPNRWVGWKLKKLQIRRRRLGHGNLRHALVTVQTLSKKVRRYAPHLLNNGSNGNNGRKDGSQA